MNNEELFCKKSSVFNSYFEPCDNQLSCSNDDEAESVLSEPEEIFSFEVLEISSAEMVEQSSEVETVALSDDSPDSKLADIKYHGV